MKKVCEAETSQTRNYSRKELTLEDMGIKRKCAELRMLVLVLTRLAYEEEDDYENKEDQLVRKHETRSFFEPLVVG